MHSTVTTDISMGLDTTRSLSSTINETSAERIMYPSRDSMTMNTEGESTPGSTDYLMIQGKEKRTTHLQWKYRVGIRMKSALWWLRYVVGTIIYIVTFTFLLQPSSDLSTCTKGTTSTILNSSNDIISTTTSVNFTRATVYSGDHQKASFSLSNLMDFTWGLGFEIRNRERVLYIWLYHRTSTDINPEPSLALWITCMKDLERLPDRFENPWNGGWKTKGNNDLEIVLVTNEVKVLLGGTESPVNASCSVDLKDILTVQMECWSLTSNCPDIRYNYYETGFVFIMNVILNLGSLVSLATVLGFVLTVLWVRFLSISIYYLLPLWKLTKDEEGHYEAC